MTIPGVRLRVHRQHSQFWPILTRLVDYYSPFCGPEAISIVVEPQVAVMCRSSTHVVLADSGPFRGLLLTILGSEMISTINEPWGVFTCRSLTLKFSPILTHYVDYYSPFWGPEAISIVVEPQGAFPSRSSTLTVLADSGPLLGLLLTVLGSRSDFHSC